MRFAKHIHADPSRCVFLCFFFRESAYAFVCVCVPSLDSRFTRFPSPAVRPRSRKRKYHHLNALVSVIDGEVLAFARVQYVWIGCGHARASVHASRGRKVTPRGRLQLYCADFHLVFGWDFSGDATYRSPSMQSTQ